MLGPPLLRRLSCLDRFLVLQPILLTPLHPLLLKFGPTIILLPVPVPVLAPPPRLLTLNLLLKM